MWPETMGIFPGKGEKFRTRKHDAAADEV